jgi:biopolymer transport protein ExbD
MTMAFGSGLVSSGGDVVSDINMVPLIDVMMVLLTHTVKLDLPQADNTPQVVKPAAIHLSIAADGAVFWNNNRLDEQALAQRLEAAAKSEPQPEIFIRGDRKVEYEHVAKTMAAVQRSGLLKLGFVTEPGR